MESEEERNGAQGLCKCIQMRGIFCRSRRPDRSAEACFARQLEWMREVMRSCLPIFLEGRTEKVEAVAAKNYA